MVSAREKIGRYNDTSTKATKTPINTMITGSISDRVAVMRVLTSSS